jgi:hypothetical protein
MYMEKTGGSGDMLSVGKRDREGYVVMARQGTVMPL